MEGEEGKGMEGERKRIEMGNGEGNRRRRNGLKWWEGKGAEGREGRGRERRR